MPVGGWLTDVDWPGLVLPRMSALELLLRGSGVYLAVFLLMRFSFKRQAGGIGLADLIVVVLISESVQNSLIGDAASVPEGIFLAAVILGWHYAIEWTSFRFPALRGLLHVKPLLLVRDGRVVRDNLAKELISEDELRSKLRENGIASLSRVRRAYREENGAISFLTRKEGR